MIDKSLAVVAWLYESEDGSKELFLDCNHEHARRLLEIGWTETPLYTRTDRKAVLEEAVNWLIDEKYLSRATAERCVQSLMERRG